MVMEYITSIVYILLHIFPSDLEIKLVWTVFVGGEVQNILTYL